jgi:hypothetical protein
MVLDRRLDHTGEWTVLSLEQQSQLLLPVGELDRHSNRRMPLIRVFVGVYAAELRLVRRRKEHMYRPVRRRSDHHGS